MQDLKELDKYPWAGHSTILGRRKNPLMPEIRDPRSEVSNQKSPSTSSAGGGFSFSFSSGKEKKKQNPENPVNPVEKKSLAEKTIEDLLLHFAETQKLARRRYREFIKKGIAQGRRPEFQGGGLVRSAGGNKAGLLGRKAEDREKGDARILGSGGFVGNVLSEGDKSQEYKIVKRIPLLELVARISNHLETDKDEVLCGNRKEKNCEARALISFFATKKMGYRFNDVAETLGIHPVTAGRCAEKGKKLVDNDDGIWDMLEQRS